VPTVPPGLELEAAEPPESWPGPVPARAESGSEVQKMLWARMVAVAPRGEARPPGPRLPVAGVSPRGEGLPAAPSPASTGPAAARARERR